MLLAALLRLYVLTKTCHFFFNITPLFAIGFISEGESSKVKQQWKICHKFQGWIMQDLPHLNNLYTTGIRKGTLHCTIITAGLKKWKVNRPLGDWIPDLALHNWDYKLTIFTFYCTNITLALEPRFRGEDPKSSQLIFGSQSSYAVHLPICL